MARMKQYSEEFKREAVRLVTQKGYSNNQAGKAVGVCHTTIRAWVSRYAPEQPAPTTYASAQDELAQLRKENARLRMERDLLKKAAAYFAAEDHR
jgi:transposase